MSVETSHPELWKQAHEKFLALDRAFANGTPDETSIAEVRAWLEEFATIEPRLAALAPTFVSKMDRRRLWCALVPAERRLPKTKTTDAEILEGDNFLPRNTPMNAVIVLDSLRSAFNVGGFFRTAECFGLSELILCGYTATPDNPAVAKAALGTENVVPWRSVADVHSAIDGLKKDGFTVVALETVRGAPSVAEFHWRFPCALVFGNERFGIEPETLAQCDAVVQIPLFGAKNSLNVVSAFAVVAHELRKAWR